MKFGDVVTLELWLRDRHSSLQPYGPLINYAQKRPLQAESLSGSE